MSPRPRLAASLLLLVVALVTIAGAGVCVDDCGIACGDCVACAVAGRLTARLQLGAAPATRLADSHLQVRPDELAARTIEHVPWLGC